jgi:hypothetical protein
MKTASWIASASFLLSAGLPARAADSPRADAGRYAAFVQVRDYTRMRAELLSSALEVAARVLGRAGIDGDFRNCTAPIQRRAAGCERTGAPYEILLEVLGPHQCAALRKSSDVLGLALMPSDGSRASYAAVFREKAEALARLGDASTSQVLGHAMAHEIGHLLLLTKEHSATGLMRARWSASDLQGAAWGQLLFTPEEATRLRERLADRATARSPWMAVKGLLPFP